LRRQDSIAPSAVQGGGRKQSATRPETDMNRCEISRHLGEAHKPAPVNQIETVEDMARFVPWKSQGVFELLVLPCSHFQAQWCGKPHRETVPATNCVNMSG